MKVDTKIIKNENSAAILEIKVDQESVKKGFEKVTHVIQSNISLPGFRKGKAPLNLIRTKYKNKINEEVLNDLVPKAYSESIKQNKLLPFTVPEIKILSFDENHLRFQADIQLQPQVKTGQYKGLSFQKDFCKIIPSDIDNELKKLQERLADYILKEGKDIEDNDIVSVKIEAFDKEGKPIKDLLDDNYRIEVKKESLFNEFYENLIGGKAGEEKEFTKKYPDNFTNQKLAGKDVSFKVKIKEVRQKKLPKLDDEFAKDVGDYKSLEELKKAIERQLKTITEYHLENRLERSILTKIVDNSKFQIPEKLIKDRSAFLLKEFKENLSRRGQDLQKMMESKVVDMTKIQDEIREQAVKDLKEYLIIIEIKKAENINVQDSEIEKKKKKEAERLKTDYEEYRKKLDDDAFSYIKHNIITRKVLEFLKDNSKFKKGKEFNAVDILKEEVKER